MKVFSVIDVETTGFNWKGSDRIIEIGIVKIDEEGKVLDSFETLVNPGRDVGPVWVHGINEMMVSRAPAFSEILADFNDFIGGTCIVAHNAAFDFRFLDSEIKRCADIAPLKGLCTLQIARALLPALPSRSLGYLAEYFGLESIHLHSAYSDAYTAAQLLVMFIKKYNYRIDSDSYILTESSPLFAGNHSTSGKRLTRKDLSDRIML